MNQDLLSKKCIPCEGGMAPLTPEEANKYMEQVDGWKLDETGKLITKEYKFSDFIGAINFVERVSDIAEMEDHHPDIHVFYNRVVLELYTHAIGGLSENDFILAAKINAHN